MATMAGESPEEKLINYSVKENISKSLAIEENVPWMDYAVQQAQIAQKYIETSFENAIQDVKSEYNKYEDIALGKIKGPRRFLYYNTMHLIVSEEALLSRADAKVKELRQSIDLLKAETEKLERSASQAEEELKRGRTKLRQTGKQIQSVNSAYKIERQAGGLKDVLKELPRREASRFRSQVSNLAKEVKQERNTLTKEVTKISNYGISV